MTSSHDPQGEDPTPPNVRYDAVEPSDEHIHEMLAHEPEPASGPGPTTTREVEVKLRVDDSFALPELTGVEGIARVEPLDLRDMTAVYHDTADLRLFRWGITLRRREGGPDAGWHLKLPVRGATGGTRDELHLPLEAGKVGDVPAALRDVVSALTREAELAPVATVRTRRTPFNIFDDSGQHVAEVVDDRVALQDSTGELADEFRELEVEAMVPGAVLAPIVEVLTAAGAEPSSMSKAAAALGAQGQAAPEVAAPQPVGPHDPAGLALTSFIRAQVREFMVEDVRVRRDLPEAVHNLRVAARRLRAALATFGPLFDAEWARALRSELDWAASEFGHARDLEVMLERLDLHAEELLENDERLIRAVVDPAIRSRMEHARAAALATMRTERYRTLCGSLVEAANSPRLTPEAERTSQQELPALLDKAWSVLERRVSRLSTTAEARLWHRARIAAKRARYAAEVLNPVFGRPAKDLATSLSEITELLGDHQDACVAQELLREFSAHTDVDGQTGFALGLLHEREWNSELLCRISFDDVWRPIKRQYRKTKWT